MPCYQSTNLPGGVTTTGRTSYATEADCLNACKEGACCEGATCTVKPACQCQGAGKVFKGVGTVCEPNPCLYGCGSCTSIPQTLTATISVSGGGDYLSAMGCVAGNSSLVLSRPNALLEPAPPGCWNSSTANCNTSMRSEYWTSGVGSGGLMFRVVGQCTAGGGVVGARIMPQMTAVCATGRIQFVFSCGRFPRTQPGCPDAYDYIGDNISSSDRYNEVQFLLNTTSCSPFVATATGIVNGVSLSVSLTGNPLP